MKLRNLCFRARSRSILSRFEDAFKFQDERKGKRERLELARIAFVLSATLPYRETATFLDDETLNRLYNIKKRVLHAINFNLLIESTSESRGVIESLLVLSCKCKNKDYDQ